MATESFRCIPPAGQQGQRHGGVGGAGAADPRSGAGLVPPNAHPRGSWSAPGAYGAAPCPGSAAPSLPSPAPPTAPSAARRTRRAPPPSGWGGAGVRGAALPAPPPHRSPCPPVPRLHVEEHVVLGTHPHGFSDAVDIGADVPAQDIGSAGGGGQEAGQDGPGGGIGGERGSWRAGPAGLGAGCPVLCWVLRARTRGDTGRGRGDGNVAAPGQSQAQLPSPPWPPAHMVVVLPAPLWPRKEVICPS